MKSIAFLIAGLSLMIGMPASAEFKTISRAHEVPFQNLGLPVSATGTLSFKECSDCDLITIRVTPQTRYVLNGEDLPLEEFRTALHRLRSAAIESNNAATVLHHLESDTVASVTVAL